MLLPTTPDNVYQIEDFSVSASECPIPVNNYVVFYRVLKAVSATGSWLSCFQHFHYSKQH